MLAHIESLDQEIVKAEAPSLFYSSSFLKYVLLSMSLKDICLQAFVCFKYQRNMWQKSLAYHYVGWCFSVPFLLAFTTWTTCCLIDYQSILSESSYDDPINLWYHVTQKLVAYATVYSFIHACPLSCIYLD